MTQTLTSSEQSVSADIFDQRFTLSSGKLAKQANGSVLLQVGDMVLLATATMSKQPRENVDFFPLTIEFAEKMYASGKIPGGYFKRESRPSTAATLIARLIDRPLRPCFPKGFHNDVQIVITVLSYDPSVPLESYSIVAASAALSVSDAPFQGPVGAALVGKIGDELIVNPSTQQLAESDLNLVVAGNKEAVLMVEAGANEVSEELIIDAIMKGHEAIKETITLQEALAAKCSKEKIAVPGKPEGYDVYKAKVADFLGNKIEQALSESKDKKATEEFLRGLDEEAKQAFESEGEENAFLIQSIFNELKKEQIRNTIISKRVRVDGRQTNEVRPLAMEVGLLPAVHGSSVFTRGETQSLGVVTLGTASDEQMIDSFEETTKSKYFLHYNFPPYSVGEVGMLRTSRRELGHGALAERAIQPVLPKHDDFPYTLRLVSEILESNGSSSMASVCSCSLALMDAGVPVTSSVSGIAMGLLMNDEGYIILSDIQGLEDHYGDMDFKVAGTFKGITALQLDIKIAGLSKEILQKALEQAKEGRHYILTEMNTVIGASREEVSENAPKIFSLFIDPEKVGLVIGPGGKMIRRLEEESGAVIVVLEGNNGEVSISAKNKSCVDRAVAMINGLVAEPEVGTTYSGTVIKIMPFGAFIEILPGKEGLLHISKISSKRVDKVEDHFNVGDTLEVKVGGIDDKKRISLELPEQK